MKSKIITFSIGKANYFVEGKDGEKVELKLDYANNSYSVKIDYHESISAELRAQVDFVANYLLKEKAQKNLVDPLRKKRILS